MTEPSRDYVKTAIPTGLPGPGIHVLDGLLTATEKQDNVLTGQPLHPIKHALQIFQTLQ